MKFSFQLKHPPALNRLIVLSLRQHSELSDEDVRTAIKNSGGVKGSLLIPEAPFELLVRVPILILLPPHHKSAARIEHVLAVIAAQSSVC